MAKDDRIAQMASRNVRNHSREGLPGKEAANPVPIVPGLGEGEIGLTESMAARQHPMLNRGAACLQLCDELFGIVRRHERIHGV